MIKVAEILIKGNHNKNGFCDLFIYEPENIEESALGNLYMSAELSSNEESLGIISLLTSLIKREYYCAPHRGPMASLEASLKKANITLNELASQGNLNWIGKLHFVCAALNKEEDLYLTQTGLAQAFICRDGQLASITNKLTSKEKSHPSKTFKSVITGKIEPLDKLIFGTPSLFNIFSPQEFAELLRLPKLQYISEQISKIARQNKKIQALSALVLEMTAEEPEFIPENSNQNFITPPINLEEILR